MNATAEKLPQQELMPKVIDFSSLPISYDITDAALEELRTQSTTLAIADVSDTKGYKAVNEFIGTVRGLWVAVEKKRKDLNEDAVAYKRRVDTEAKRIDAVLREIAKPLQDRKDVIDAEKERIKNEKALQEQKRVSAIQERIAEITSMAVVARTATSAEIEAVITAVVAVAVDQTFGEFVQQAELAKSQALAALRQQFAEAVKAEQEAAAQAAEKERMAQERAELERQQRELAEQQRIAREAEEKRQAEIAEQQRIAQAKLDEQRQQMEAQQRQIEADRLKVEEERVAQERARERAEIERQAREKAEAEAAAKVEQERQDREAAEQKERDRLAAEEAAKPELDRICAYMQAFLDGFPEVTNPDAMALRDRATQPIAAILLEVF